MMAHRRGWYPEKPCGRGLLAQLRLRLDPPRIGPEPYCGRPTIHQPRHGNV